MMTMLPATFNPVDHVKIPDSESIELQKFNDRREYLKTVKERFLTFCKGLSMYTENAKLNELSFYMTEANKLLSKKTYLLGLHILLLNAIDYECNQVLQKVVEVWLKAEHYPIPTEIPVDVSEIDLMNLYGGSEWFLSKFITDRNYSTCIQSLFTYSLIRSNAVAAEIFLKMGANANALYSDRSSVPTALHFATGHGDEKMVSVILANGGNPRIGGYNLVDCAARRGNKEIKRMLEEAGVRASPTTWDFIRSKL